MAQSGENTDQSSDSVAVKSISDSPAFPPCLWGFAEGSVLPVTQRSYGRGRAFPVSHALAGPARAGAEAGTSKVT